MISWFKKLSRPQKIALAVIAVPFVIIPVLSIVVMSLSAYQTEVTCKDKAIEPDTALEAQADELKNVSLINQGSASWQQNYVGRNCGNSTQKLEAQQTVTLGGMSAGSVIRNMRSELSTQGYDLKNERYTIINKDTCAAKYFANFDLQDGGKVTVVLEGVADTPCNKSGWITESEFASTSATSVRAYLVD